MVTAARLGAAARVDRSVIAPPAADEPGASGLTRRRNMAIEQPAPVGAGPSSVEREDFAVVGVLAQRFTLLDGGWRGAVAEAVVAPGLVVQREGPRCVHSS